MNIFNNGNKNKSYRLVVRLSTSSWLSNGELNIKKSLRILKRKSFGFNIIEEDVNNIGAYDVVSRIVNLNESNDGVYLLDACNEKRDFESGFIDSYDYKLVKFKEP